jgi:hypothetical protein
MLPGFRFLFAAIVLTMSVLVFGLGAAALLRAAHEEFASTPAWQAPPETKFAQQTEPTRPVMAMLRVEPPAAEKAPGDVRPAPPPMEPTAPASTPAAQDAVVATPADPAATVSAAVESEKIAPPEPEEASPPAPAKPEMPAAEIAVPTDATPVQAETPPVIAEAGTATIEQQVAPPVPVPPPANEATQDEATQDQVAEPANSAQVSPSTDTASTKVATLGGPPVTVESSLPPAVSAKPDQSAIKKRQQARRAAQRRRIAARARLAQQPQPADPFAPAAPVARAR